MTSTTDSHPIETAYKAWIGSFPESYHPLDMKRFYVLVKTVHRYSRQTNPYQWFSKKIQQSKLDGDCKEYYLGLFQTLLDFCDAHFLDHRVL